MTETKTAEVAVAAEPETKVSMEWSKSICPVLSVATIKAASSEAPRIFGATVERVEKREGYLQACQGPKCALFMPITDQHGRVYNGACSLSLVPTAINQLTNVISQLIPRTSEKN